MDAELKKGAGWYPILSGGGTGRGVCGGGNPSGVSTIRVVQKNKKHPPACRLNFYMRAVACRLNSEAVKWVPCVAAVDGACCS